jgi:hypothetical protein
MIRFNQERGSGLAHRRAMLLLAPDVDALHAPGIDRDRTHTNKRLVSGMMSLLGISRVVVGSIESLPAFRAAKQAVPALAIESVTALQACNACGDLFASQLCE